jgi:hypothetical protein
MKGYAAMTQGIIVWLLLMGLVGLIWVMVLDILSYNYHSHDERQGSASPEPRDGDEPHDAHHGSQLPRPDKGTWRLHPDSLHTDMQQKQQFVNHLVINGMHQPMLPSLPSQKQRVTVSLPTPLIERLRNAVYWTEDRPLACLVAEAIEDIVTQMEEVNGGAFPQRVSPLKRGRRQRERSPVHSTAIHSPDSEYSNR